MSKRKKGGGKTAPHFTVETVSVTPAMIYGLVASGVMDRIKVAFGWAELPPDISFTSHFLDYFSVLNDCAVAYSRILAYLLCPEKLDTVVRVSARDNYHNSGGAVTLCEYIENSVALENIKLCTSIVYLSCMCADFFINKMVRLLDEFGDELDMKQGLAILSAMKECAAAVPDNHHCEHRCSDCLHSEKY